MKLKAILILTLFFVGTPLILGQTGLPSVPNLPSTPNINTPSLPGFPSSTPTLPGFSTPTMPTALSADTLRNAGINTSSLTSNATALASQIPDQGILNNAFSTPLPNRDNAADMAKSFAQKLFPEEFAAAQGKIAGATSLAQSATSRANAFQTPNLNDVSSSARSFIPSAPSTPGFQTPTLPATPTFTPPSI